MLFVDLFFFFEERLVYNDTVSSSKNNSRLLANALGTKCPIDNCTDRKIWRDKGMFRLLLVKRNNKFSFVDFICNFWIFSKFENTILTLCYYIKILVRLIRILFITFDTISLNISQRKYTVYANIIYIVYIFFWNCKISCCIIKYTCTFDFLQEWMLLSEQRLCGSVIWKNRCWITRNIQHIRRSDSAKFQIIKGIKVTLLSSVSSQLNIIPHFWLYFDF